jgi:hypothetical protein
MGSIRIILFFLFPLLLSCCFNAGHILTKGEIRNMKERYLFNQNGRKAYMPLMYGLKNQADKIFTVPGVNRVGTLQYDNGLTMIDMADDEHLKYKLIAKNYDDEIFGDYVYSFSPIYSENEFLYSQAYDVYKINLSSGEVTSYDLYKTLLKKSGINIHRIQLVNKPGTFLLEFQMPNVDHEIKEGKLITFSDNVKVGDSLKLGFHSYSYDQPWQYNNGIIFTYDSVANKIICHTSEFKDTTHPFAEIFNRNNCTFRKLKEFSIHPKLPFGVVIEIGKDIDWEKYDKLPPTLEREKITDALVVQASIHALYLIRWDTPDTNKQFVPLFTEPASVIPGLHPLTYSDFQWSPDGKWLVFRDETQYQEYKYGNLTAEENPVFIALPVSEKNQLFIGEPLYLGKVMREKATPQSSAWIQKPVSFVVSDGLMLYKWDLDNVGTATKVNSPNDVVPVK